MRLAHGRQQAMPPAEGGARVDAESRGRGSNAETLLQTGGVAAQQLGLLQIRRRRAREVAERAPAADAAVSLAAASLSPALNVAVPAPRACEPMAEARVSYCSDDFAARLLPACPLPTLHDVSSTPSGDHAIPTCVANTSREQNSIPTQNSLRTHTPRCASRLLSTSLAPPWFPVVLARASPPFGPPPRGCVMLAATARAPYHQATRLMRHGASRVGEGQVTSR